jgi:hypothetical protein
MNMRKWINVVMTIAVLNGTVVMVGAVCYNKSSSSPEVCTVAVLGCSLRAGDWALKETDTDNVKGEYVEVKDKKCGVRALVMDCGVGIKVVKSPDCPPNT